MYAVFALLLLLLLPGDNADLLKINYGKLLEQCMVIMHARIHILCLHWIWLYVECTVWVIRFLITHKIEHTKNWAISLCRFKSIRFLIGKSVCNWFILYRLYSCVILHTSYKVIYCVDVVIYYASMYLNR